MNIGILRDLKPAARLERWLPDMDLNHDKQIQSLLCYRYTIGQTSAYKLGVRRGESRLAIGEFRPTARREHGHAFN